MAAAESWKFQKLLVAEFETASRNLQEHGADMEQIEIEFSSGADAVERNQQLVDMVVQHCTEKLDYLHFSGLTKRIILSAQMPNIKHLLIRDSEIGPGNKCLNERFPNVQYLELHKITGAKPELADLYKQSFIKLTNLWLDCSNLNNRVIRTFLERNPRVVRLSLEFRQNGTDMTNRLFEGINKEMKNLENLTILPAIPRIPPRQQTFTYQPKLFQELQELTISGYYDSQFDLLSYLSISNENVKRMNIQATDLNETTIKAISFYVCLLELTISADAGLNFENLTNLVGNLTGLYKIEIITAGSVHLRNVDEMLAFVNRFAQLNEVILKDSLPVEYVDALRNGLDNAIWSVESPVDGIIKMVRKPQNE